ncbi:hypothetical protein V6Z11_A08G281200 [Gossypium hirsutum]
MVTQTQQATATQSIVQPTSSTNENWASFDVSPQTNVSETSSNVNTLDSVLSQLSVPVSVTGHLSGVPSGVGGQLPAHAANMNVAPSTAAFTGQIQTMPFGAGAPAFAPVGNFSTLPPTGPLVAASGLTHTVPGSSGSSQIGVNNAGQWPNMQHQQTHFFSTAGGQTSQQLNGASPSQPWNFAPSPHMQGPQAVSKPFQDVTSAVASQQPPTETKASGRQELPADLFTATYPTYPAPTPGWQMAPPRGMGFTMQYHTAAPPSAFPQSLRSVNPFDLGGEAPRAQTQTPLSMASLQGALPNLPPPSGLLRTSSLGTPSSAWMPPQSLPYASGIPSQSLPYASALPQRPYLGAQLPGNLLSSSHQAGGIGSESSYGFINTDQHVAGRFSAPATPQPFSSVGGGNPFG